MFNINDLQKIEIELTTQCQASCPMCSRNFHGLIPNDNIKNVSWNIDDYRKIMDYEILKNVKLISFCGTYGDPLICRDIVEICRYTKENSKAQLIISTNGSLYTPNWWSNFAKNLPEDHRVIFGIDGFKGTHEKHRIGTDFDKIIHNAKSFIKANGNAEAQFISFSHNSEEFEDLRQYLLDIGFSNVFKKYSYRFRHNSFVVLDKNKKESERLFPDASSKVVNYKDEEIPSILQKAKNADIVCRAMHNKEIYIDAYKHLYPCCETAGMRYEIERLDEPYFNSLLPKLKNQLYNIHKEYNNLGYIDVRKHSIKSVLHDSKYKEIWEKYWRLKASFVCNVVCGKIQDKKFYDMDSQFESRFNNGGF